MPPANNVPHYSLAKPPSCSPKTCEKGTDTRHSVCMSTYYLYITSGTLLFRRLYCHKELSTFRRKAFTVENT